MLPINPQSITIKKAKQKYIDGMTDIILRRIDYLPKKSCESLNQIDNRKRVINFFDDFIIPDLENILSGSPSVLLNISESINPFIRNNDFRIGIKYVFNYDYFKDKSNNRYTADDLAQSLKISTCPYCNRNYTNCIQLEKGKKIIRPAFDHYFDKATHPLLAVSFYNLIPSCTICNSDIKGGAQMKLEEHLHPYLDNCIDEFSFSYKYSLKSQSGIEVVINSTNDKVNNTLSNFGIKEVYNTHCDEVIDMIKIRNYFNDRYLSILSSNLLKDIIVSKEEMYRIVFGTEYQTKEFINKPFSKFKKDILLELGVINKKVD